MVIYIDVLFCLNMFVNYFLLLSVSAIGRTKTPFLRLLLGALSGAAVSLAIFLPPMHFLLDALLKAVYCGVIVLVCFSFGSLRRFLRLYAAFMGCSFGFAGIMLAIWFTFRPSGMAINNSVVYFNISPVLLIISTVLSYIIIKAVCRFAERKTAKSDIYTLDIFMNSHTVSCSALLDTGNNLRDLFSGDPVIIAEYELIKPLLTKRAQFAFASGTGVEPMTGNYRLIPYSAVGKEGFLPAFRPDKICVAFGGRQHETDRVMIAVSSTPLGSEYKALISRDIAEYFI